MAVRMLFSFGFIFFPGLAFGENVADTGRASEPGGSVLGSVVDKSTQLYDKSTQLLKDHPVIAAAAVGVVAGPLAAPLMVNAIGFGQAGIAAGSWAASLMSSYGGTVAANSVCAMLQSVGVTGLATQGIAAASAVGGASTALLAKVGETVMKKSPGAEGEEAGEQAAEGQVREDLPATCEEQIKAGGRAAETQGDVLAVNHVKNECK